ncbi:MAG TPA: NADP-dependent oxidoreductase [Planctomycetota bacterium]|nr:NADP-dependent oxidoreductase [Planctomycetota bacterium]
MRAVRMHAYGGPEVLQLEALPRPEPGPGEVLVAVHAAGVNPVDWKIREGAFGRQPGSLPRVLGFDVAGVVAAVGEGVERLAVGDEVYGYLSLQRGGGYAEYVVAPEAELAAKPATLDFVAAAAVPLAALTAWQALIETAGLEEGQTVLVHAGAGGVGHFAVQIAVARGAKVIATASERNHAFLRELGAEQVIDYRTQRFEELVRDVDVVLDPIGGETRTRSYGVLKPGGFLVSIVGAPPPAELEAHGVSGAGILVRPDAKGLAELAEMIDLGALRPEVSHMLPLAEAAAAHTQSETGHTRGKIVLVVVPPREKR